MQQAIPYRIRLPTDAVAGGPSSQPTSAASIDAKSVRQLVEENAVVVFARRGCCMCLVVKLLLQGHGAYPFIFDVDESNEADVNEELSTIISGGGAPQFPAVFVGGELFGGLEKVMGAHISGELEPRLRQARALWL